MKLLIKSTHKTVILLLEKHPIKPYVVLRILKVKYISSDNRMTPTILDIKI